MEVLPCLDDSAVQDLVHGCLRLLSLDVGSCRRISNVAFQIIGKHGKTLKRLSAAGCVQLNVSGSGALATRGRWRRHQSVMCLHR